MHAILIESTYDSALALLPETVRVPGPDIVHLQGVRMGIDEVRSLIREAYLTPFSGSERVFILAYAAFTEEAQNALLKLLEEPPRTARFFIVTERSGVLLPTLRSRLMISGDEMAQEPPPHIDTFLRLPYGERIAEIGNRAQKKDDAWLISLMEAFEAYAHESHDRTFMSTFLELKPLFHTQGASRKMILEHLSLLLPPYTEIR